MHLKLTWGWVRCGRNGFRRPIIPQAVPIVRRKASSSLSSDHSSSHPSSIISRCQVLGMRVIHRVPRRRRRVRRVVAPALGEALVATTDRRVRARSSGRRRVLVLRRCPSCRCGRRPEQTGTLPRVPVRQVVVRRCVRWVLVVVQAGLEVVLRVVPRLGGCVVRMPYHAGLRGALVAAQSLRRYVQGARRAAGDG